MREKKTISPEDLLRLERIMAEEGMTLKTRDEIIGIILQNRNRTQPKPQAGRTTEQPIRSLDTKSSRSSNKSTKDHPKISRSKKAGLALGAAVLALAAGSFEKGYHDGGTSQAPGTQPGVDDGGTEVLKVPVPLVDGLTQEQMNLIASVDVGDPVTVKDSQGNSKLVTKEMKVQGMIDMLKVFNDQEIRDYAQQNGINLTVLFAQFALESAYGHSDKAEFHNYFGIKKPSGWAGPVVTLPAVEGGYADWPVFPDAKTGVMEAMKIFVAKEWYKDARAHANDISLYIDGMQNQLDATGAIEIAGKLAYAGDPLYKEKLLELITRLQLVKLVNAPLYVEVPVPKKNQTETRLQNFKLDPAKYAASGQDKWNVDFPKDWMVKLADGSVVPLNSLSWEQRYQMLETQLNKIVLTKAGYEKFQQNLQDISGQVAAEGLATFNYDPFESNDQVKFFVAHYTVTNSNPSLTAIQAARSMNGSGQGVSTWKYIDKNLNASILTYRQTGNILGYNEVTRGTEVEAQSQETITADQYEQLIYSLIDDLYRHGRLTEKSSSEDVKRVVNGQIRGHGEFHAGHSDFNSIVMDPIRILMKDFLINQLGHNKDLEVNIAMQPNAIQVGPDGKIQSIRIKDLALAA